MKTKTKLKHKPQVLQARDLMTVTGGENANRPVTPDPLGAVFPRHHEPFPDPIGFIPSRR